MTKLGRYSCAIESGWTILLLFLMPFPLDLGLRYFLIFLLSQFVGGRYQKDSLLVWDEIRKILRAFLVLFLIILFLLPYRTFNWPLFWWSLAFIAADLIGVMVVTRYSHYWFWERLKKNTLILGTGNCAFNLVNVAEHNHFSLLDIISVIEPEENKKSEREEDFAEKISTIHPLYPMAKLEQVLQENSIDCAFVALPGIDHQQTQELVNLLTPYVKEIKFLPQMSIHINNNSKIEDFDGEIMISVSNGTTNKIQKKMKRGFDILCSIPGLIVLVPITGLVYIINRKSGDTDPIFFKQKRIGQGGELFEIYKFRTMVPNADQVLEDLMASDPKVREEYERNKKLKDDPRITKAGKILRKTSLDEFPQFINVFKGDMSIVGPRPYLPREIKDMGDAYEHVIKEKPGITGMWQTHGRSEVDFQKRLELDSYYYLNWNFWLDIVLLARTAKDLLIRSEAATAE